MIMADVKDQLDQVIAMLMKKNGASYDDAVEATHAAYLRIQDKEYDEKATVQYWYVAAKNCYIDANKEKTVPLENYHVGSVEQPDISEKYQSKKLDSLINKLPSSEWTLLEMIRHGFPNDLIARAFDWKPSTTRTRKSQLIRKVKTLVLLLLIPVFSVAQDINVTQGADTLLTIPSPSHEAELYENISVGVNSPFDNPDEHNWTVSGQTTADSVAIHYDCNDAPEWQWMQSSNRYVIYDQYSTECTTDATITLRFYHDSDATDHTEFFPEWILIPEPEDDNMSQYFNDFSQYTTGLFPNDWTKIWDPEPADITVEGVSGATGGQVLRLTNGSGTSNRHMVAWNEVPESLQMEVYARVRTNNFNENERFTVGARLSGTANSRTGYFNRPRSTDNFDGVELLNGSGASSGQPILSETWQNNTWYIVGIRLDPNLNAAVDIKVWIDGTNEPAWTDALLTGLSIPAGLPGLGGMANSVVEYDWIGVGINGDEAPREPIAQDINIDASLLNAPQTVTGLADLHIKADGSLANSPQFVSGGAGTLLKVSGTLNNGVQVIQSAAGVGIESQATLTNIAQSLASQVSLTVAADGALTNTPQTLEAQIGAGIPVSVALQNAAQSLQAQSAVKVLLESDLSNSPQSINADGTVTIKGTADLANVAQSLQSQAAVEIQSNVAIANAPQSLQAQVGAEVARLLNTQLVNAAQSLNASFDVDISADGALVNAPQVLRAQAKAIISITGDLANASQSINADAVLQPLTISVQLTNGSQTIAADGQVVVSLTAATENAPQQLRSIISPVDTILSDIRITSTINERVFADSFIEHVHRQSIIENVTIKSPL